MSNDQRYTRSQARAKSQAMDNDIVPEDSVSQVSKEHSMRMTSSLMHPAPAARPIPLLFTGQAGAESN